VKYLLVVMVVMVFVWRWRNARLGPVEQSKAPRGPRGEPLTMVSCLQCGLHLPQIEAVSGTKGMYCSAAHRQLQEP
jgi:uncharacterized protein